MAELADAALDAALLVARAAVGPQADDVALAVIAMGKTGARELNYVSDVDVVYVVAPVEGRQVPEEELLAAGGRYAAMWRSQDLSEETDAAALTAQIDRLRAESAGQEEK